MVVAEVMGKRKRGGGGARVYSGASSAVRCTPRRGGKSVQVYSEVGGERKRAVSVTRASRPRV